MQQSDYEIVGKFGFESRPHRRKKGGLAQLARASALHAEGQRFESVILHRKDL